MEADDKLGKIFEYMCNHGENYFHLNKNLFSFSDRLDGLAKRKSEKMPQTMEDFLQVPDYYDTENTSDKKRVRMFR